MFTSSLLAPIYYFIVSQLSRQFSSYLIPYFLILVPIVSVRLHEGIEIHADPLVGQARCQTCNSLKANLVIVFDVTVSPIAAVYVGN